MVYAMHALILSAGVPAASEDALMTRKGKTRS
jgi:hypothetical protein